MNQLILNGQLIRSEPLAYTPAGIPSWRGVWSHQSEQQEGEFRRNVRLEIEVMASGPMASALAGLSAPVSGQIQGFLAAKSIHQAKPVLHITAYLPG